MKKKVRRLIGLIVGIGAIYIILLNYPNPLFTFDIQYKNFEIFSDRPIPKEINIVIDDAVKRLEYSELYKSNYRFKLYLCNEDWRFRFFTRNKNAGGVVNFLFSPNIFIRENIIEKNQLVPPKTWNNPLTDRPLSYFIAHEATHSLQREYDKLLIFAAPIEVVEGYAEYIGKSKTNNLDNLKENFADNSPSMNPKSGLYDKYNLYIRYLIEEKGYNFERIVQEQPDIEKSLEELMGK
jgi:hypothetical protein